MLDTTLPGAATGAELHNPALLWTCLRRTSHGKTLEHSLAGPAPGIRVFPAAFSPLNHNPRAL